MNADDRTSLVDSLRGLFRVYMLDSDMVLITPDILRKVKNCQGMGGDVSCRANLLLKKWSVSEDENESIGNEEEFKPTRTSSWEEKKKHEKTSRVACGECEKTFSNKANLVRHQRAEHAKRALVEEEEQPMSRTRRARIGN